MVATKLRVISWTQRRSCISANFRSSFGEAVTTYWIGLFRSRLSSGTPGSTRELRKTKVVFRPHHDHLFAERLSPFIEARE
jgi:hypothetical protein